MSNETPLIAAGEKPERHVIVAFDLKDSDFANTLGFPIFILFFILAVALNSLLMPSEEVNYILKTINKICLLTGLFCIGTQIDRSAIKQISTKPLVLAFLIWAIVIPTSLLVIH